MTTERILDKIYYIATHSKKSRKVLDEISDVQNAINKIKNFDLRDSLEERLTKACCN